jgi:uncharacterized protein
MSESNAEIPLGVVSLFPLPNVVLFPRAVLPLHIFEERYKAMTAAALAGDRRIAIALLKPGWEKNYYQRPAIEPIVCVGNILESEKLPDGKYNLLLQGAVRARVLRELDASKPYRRAELQELPEKQPMEIDLANERQRLAAIFGDGALANTPVGRQIRLILSSPMPTAHVADLVAFNFLDDVAMKQSLLAEPDPAERIRRILNAVETIGPLYEARIRRAFSDPSEN